MKRIILLICSLIVLLYSISSAVAGGGNLSMWEKVQVKKIGSKMIQTINNAWGCETKLYKTISQKLITLELMYVQKKDYKKAEIFTQIQGMFFDQWNNCSSPIEEEIISNLLWKAEGVIHKKWTFKKYIWAGIEARQNSMYTYFYHNERLINTIKNKINNDSFLLFGKNYNNSAQNNSFLNMYYSGRKLNLYSAYSYFDPDGIEKIEFSKLIDTWKKRYIYNVHTAQWER